MTLAEAGVSLKQATNPDNPLGLVVKNDGTQLTLVLYNPFALAIKAQKWAQDDIFGDQNELMKHVVDQIFMSESFLGVIKGYLTAVPSKQFPSVWEVSESYAVGKHGPLLYDIAMSQLGWLTSDHEGDSSTDAQGVWQFYLNNRTDVVSKPLVAQPISAADYAFKAKRKANITPLVTAHNNAAQSIATDIRSSNPRIGGNFNADLGELLTRGAMKHFSGYRRSDF
jgi:hypothetical protein